MSAGQMQDSEGLRRVEEKLDKLIEGLPKTYASQVETDRRFAAIESIIKSIQSQIEMWAGIYRQEMKWAVEEHQGIHKAVEESERRILTELKENTKITQDNKKTMRANRLMFWASSIGWAITIILFIAGTLITHWWR